jgi:predicted DNA-binding protein
MLEVKLTRQLESALDDHARRARKSKTNVVRAAIEEYLQNAADYEAILESRKRRGRSYSIAKVRQRFGSTR